MITITKKERERIIKDGSIALVELAGLSTDEKPTEMGTTKIENGSTFIEMDTGKIFLYDEENEEWQEI
jgi:hypothetical protein